LLKQSLDQVFRMSIDATENDAEIARTLAEEYELVWIIFICFSMKFFLLKVLNRIYSIPIRKKDQNHIRLFHRKDLKLIT
jgi:hypothetical protein